MENTQYFFNKANETQFQYFINLTLVLIFLFTYKYFITNIIIHDYNIKYTLIKITYTAVQYLVCLVTGIFVH